MNEQRDVACRDVTLRGRDGTTITTLTRFTHTACVIVLTFLIIGMNPRRTQAELAGEPSEDKRITAEDVEVVQLEKLPKTIGGWTHSVKGQWMPLSEDDARALLGGSISGKVGKKDVRNSGNGWTSGMGFKLRKPTALQKIVVDRGIPGYINLKSIVVYSADGSEGKEVDIKDWFEVETLQPDKWPAEGGIQISIEDSKPHLWWGVCFAPPVERKSGSISIGGIRLFAR